MKTTKDFVWIYEGKRLKVAWISKRHWWLYGGYANTWWFSLKAKKIIIGGMAWQLTILGFSVGYKTK